MERKVLIIAKEKTSRIDDLAKAIEGWLGQENFVSVDVSVTTDETVKRMLSHGYDKIVSVFFKPDSFSPQEVSAKIFAGGTQTCFVI